MSLPTREETLTEFCLYVRDICSQSAEEQGNRLETVLARLMDTAVRIAASQLVPIEADIAAWSDEELAEAMRRHVVFRDGVRLKNSAWHMMIEHFGCDIDDLHYRFFGQGAGCHGGAAGNST